MRRMRRLGEYVLFIGCMCALGIWLCESDLWNSLRQWVVQWPVFCNLQGKREGVSSFLMGNCIGAFGVSFGFYVEYFEKKKENEKELESTYRYLRKQCFNKIFCQANYYDQRYDEVEEMYEYLDKKRDLLLDYRPRIIVIKARIQRFCNRFKKKTTQTVDYSNEDKHILISSIIGALYKYFYFIYIYQMQIQDEEECMKICKQYMNDDKSFKTYYVYAKHTKKIHVNRLRARFPDNNKSVKAFFDKKDIYLRTRAVNDTMIAACGFYSSDKIYYLFPEKYIVEDEPICYGATDREINYFLTSEEVEQLISSEIL